MILMPAAIFADFALGSSPLFLAAGVVCVPHLNHRFHHHYHLSPHYRHLQAVCCSADTNTHSDSDTCDSHRYKSTHGVALLASACRLLIK